MRIVVRAHKMPFDAVSAEETLRRNSIGNNVGNLVFSQAVIRQLWRRDHTIERLTNLDVKRVQERADVVVIPLANAFRRSFIADLDALSAFIEQLEIPVVVPGVGAQVRLDHLGKRDEQVDNAVRRFVSAVLSGSPSIGVRGEFTRDYLVDLGFPDDAVDVIGCPSMFMFGPDLPPLRESPEITADHRIAFNASPYRKWVGPLSTQAAQRHPRLTYFAQDLKTLRLLVNGHYTGKALKQAPVTLDHPLIDQGRTLMCLDPATWISELSTYDYSFGTRIHGNITALLSGTPATVLSHDSRTRELADYHLIPHIQLTEDIVKTPAPELYAQSDWGPMIKAHDDRWLRYAAFFSRHGLRHTFEPDDSPAEFDRLLSAIEFPPPVRTLRNASLEELYALKQAATRPSKWSTTKARAVRWARERTKRIS